jgi:hypothetical protein
VSGTTIPDDDGARRVIPLRRSGRAGMASPRPAHQPAAPDLAQYERGGDEDDYRHRMMVNGAALLFTVLLVVGGIWLAIKMAELRKNQDCVFAGRLNCTQIDVHRPARQP